MVPAIILLISTFPVFSGVGINPLAAAELDTDAEVARLLGAFDAVVFGSDLGSAMRQQRVAKWTGPVRVAVRYDAAGGSEIAEQGGKVPPWIRDAVASHLRRLARLSGLDIGLLDGESSQPAANIRLTLTTRQGINNISFDGVSPAVLRQLRGPGRCFFIYWVGQPGNIERAEIVINSQLNYDHIRHCIIEEITQALGLPNDTNLVRPSIFSDHDRLLELAPTDEILLQVLYGPRMRVALGREAALWVAGNSLRQLLIERSTL